MSNSKKNDEKWFWSIIDLVQRNRAELKTILSNFTKEEIYAFQDHFVEMSTEFQDEPYTDYMESSEDGQEDVAHWVVSGGKKYYEQILEEPSKIPHTVEGKNDGNLYGIASEVYYGKFQEELDIY